MKKHDLQIDGQINLFDLLESVENTPSDISSDLRISQDEKDYKYDNPILNHLLEDLGKIFTIKKVEYEIWEHVPKLGKRLWFELADLPEDWNLEPYIEKYKKYDLEISITEHSIQEDVLNFEVNELWGSTLWKTKNHKERTDWKEDKAADQEEAEAKTICIHSQHECNMTELWKVADELDEIKCPHTCCRKCEEKLCGARCNDSEEPKAAEPPKLGKVGDWVQEHGKRILFDDIKENSYYIADYSNISNVFYKLVYTKKKTEDSLMYVDAEKGIKAEWQAGNSFSCTTRKEYVDSNTPYCSWWYELPEEEKKIALPLSKRYCYVIGSDCGCMTQKGCLYPDKCDFMKKSVESVNEERKEKEQETAREDIETIEDKTALWLWSDYLPYIVKQIMKTHSWLTESIREFTYNNDKDYHNPLVCLFIGRGFKKTSYNFMVDDTEFELAPSIYEEVYFIRCSKILDSEGNLLTQTNITAKDIVLELMKEPRPVHIKGICDDAYCPECNYALDELKELDCEKCPICGALIDWTPWHRKNDKETEDEKVNS